MSSGCSSSSGYTDPSHPYFLDFKRFGTAGGPKGWAPVAPIEYHSKAAGKIVRGSPFEPAGNFFYGMIGSLSGFTNDELMGAAWLFQQGRSGAYDKYVRNFMQDSPQDVPHISFGISVAAKFTSGDGAQVGISAMPSKSNCDKIFEMDEPGEYTFAWIGPHSLVVVTDNTNLKLKTPPAVVAEVTLSTHMPEHIFSSLSLDEKHLPAAGRVDWPAPQRRHITGLSCGSQSSAEQISMADISKRRLQFVEKGFAT